MPADSGWDLLDLPVGKDGKRETGMLVMTVANNGIIDFQQDIDIAGGAGSGGIVYPAVEVIDGEYERDARGLLMALLFCLICWVALGFFLLG